MRPKLFLAAAALLVCNGCMTHNFLRRQVTRQTSTVMDMVQQQVLDNVAMFAANRDAMPSLVTISDGTTQTQDAGILQPTFLWNATSFTGASMFLNAQRQLMENWKLQPVMSAGRLRRLRCAFQMLYARPTIALSDDCLGVCAPDGCVKCIEDFVAVGFLTPPKKAEEASSLGNKAVNGCWRFKDPLAAERYARLLQDELDCKIPTGWFCTGPKPPKDACFTGECCGTYAWVAPGGSDAFSRFTLSVLVLSTVDPAPSRPEMDLYFKAETASKFSQLQQSMGALSKAYRTLKGPNGAEMLPPLQLQQLDNAAAGEPLSTQQLLELRDWLKDQQDTIRESAKSNANERELQTLMNQAELAIVRTFDAPPPAPGYDPGDAFERPATSPLSRGGGIEYAPILQTP